MVVMDKVELYVLFQLQWPDCDIKIPDKTYQLPTRHQIWNELISSYIEDYEYQKEICDCDDFNLFLHAWIRQRQYQEQWKHPLAFGEAWSSTHAFNITVLDNKDIYLVEPQSSSNVLLPPSTYDVDFIRL